MHSSNPNWDQIGILGPKEPKDDSTVTVCDACGGWYDSYSFVTFYYMAGYEICDTCYDDNGVYLKLLEADKCNLK